MANQYLERVHQNAVNDALAQAQWSEKKWVWVADKQQGYLQGFVVSEHGDEVEIQLSDDTVSRITLVYLYTKMFSARLISIWPQKKPVNSTYVLGTANVTILIIPRAISALIFF